MDSRSAPLLRPRHTQARRPGQGYAKASSAVDGGGRAHHISCQKPPAGSLAGMYRNMRNDLGMQGTLQVHRMDEEHIYGGGMHMQVCTNTQQQRQRQRQCDHECDAPCCIICHSPPKPRKEAMLLLHQPQLKRRTETRRRGVREEDGSASPKSLLRGPAVGAAAGICEGDGSSGLCRALAAAAGGYNYMRTMMQQAAMGVAAAGAPPPAPRRAADDVVVVEPRGAGIKQQQQQSADDGEHTAPPSNKHELFTFLGFVVAPGPPPPACCRSRDHPFEMVGAAGLANHSAATTSGGEARLPCSLETTTVPPGKDAAANPPSSSSVASAGDDEYGCSLSLSLALDTTRSSRSGDEGSLLSPTTSSTGSRISLDLSLSTVDPSN
ncbi:hypothetical protein BS78_01G494400 [Paspalum vaginatum]|nr:hypothetical protein BS78_01G494400 [Paspalum vaginatum]